MDILLLVYTLKTATLKLLWLLWLVPAVMIPITLLFVKKSRAVIDKKMAEDDAKIAVRMAEKAEEKKLEDDFGFDRFDDDGNFIDENGLPKNRKK